MESSSDFSQSDPRQLWTIRRLGRMASIRPRSMPSKAAKGPPGRRLTLAVEPMAAPYSLELR